MFTIPTHGVTNNAAGLSTAQQHLLDDEAPIRVCGAPTGSGKTYAFLKAASEGKRIFFVVPTQALAEDIRKHAEDKSILVYKWDANEIQKALENNEIPWANRQTQVEEVANKGGMIIATLEALAHLTVAFPRQEHVSMTIMDVLNGFHHLVFDEAHTLGTRAFGLVHFWSVMIAARHWKGEQTLKLTFLSATHSNLMYELLGKTFLLPKSVRCFDEKFIDKQPGYRPIHGDVEVHLHNNDDLLAVVRAEGKNLLNTYNRLLLVYDNLKQALRDKRELYAFLETCGVSTEQVIMNPSQDRNKVQKKHCVIIGTAAIEIGVNFDIDAAIIDPAMDAAALLQRIGRVARGEHSGVIHICKSSQHKGTPSHVLNLTPLSGQQPIEKLRKRLAPLRNINGSRARNLGSAYWSMLSGAFRPHFRLQSALIRRITEIFEELDGAKKMPVVSQLNELHKIANDEDPDWRGKHEFERWLKAIDRELQDVREFSPTIQVRFKDKPFLISYNRDWVARYLRAPDHYVEGVYVYDKNREDCFREGGKAKPLAVKFFSPIGSVAVTDSYHWQSAFKRYCDKIKKGCEKEPSLSQAYDFIQKTGLLARSDSKT
jgi:CRISPR-associated helicase Cas3